MMTINGIRAKKSLGQNFLIDHEALSDIANSLLITGKHIIEVGPGYGALTDYILEWNPASLNLVELDSDMVRILEEKLWVKSEEWRIKSDELRVKNTIWWQTKNGKTERDKLSASEYNLQNRGSGVKHCLSDDEILNHVEQSDKERVWFTPESFGTFGHESTEEITWEWDGTWDAFSMTEPPITLHHQDILTFTPSHEKYSVIANIPYYITSPILFHFLYPNLRAWWKTVDMGAWGEGAVWTVMKNSTTISEASTEWVWLPPNSFGTFEIKSTEKVLFKSPVEMTIMMQSEVWEKILEGRARKPHHSFISLAMEQACEDIEIVRYVPRTSFDPAPRVDSIVLKFTVKPERDLEMEKCLIQLWKVAFAHPRKTLLSNMKWSTYNLEHIQKTLTEHGYDERVRAEAVKKEDWESFL